jgi:hypothetical protein
MWDIFLKKCHASYDTCNFFARPTWSRVTRHGISSYLHVLGSTEKLTNNLTVVGCLAEIRSGTFKIQVSKELLAC